jgi:3'(2'), 5'-bisphosphate nucleotidase
LEIYHSAESAWELEFKKDTTPLTLADKQSNEIICKRLKKLAPDIPVISEENSEIPFSERKFFEYYWLIDPLDGTKEFIKRNGEFTINIALIQKNEAIFGITSVPCQNIMYYALKGNGAFRLEQGKNLSRIFAREFDLKDDHLIIAASRSHMNQETRDYIEQFPNASLVIAGSALKFMMIAEGRAHIYPRFGRTMEWDSAASQIIVEEAGGKVVHAYHGSRLEYNKKDLSNEGFIVYGKMKNPLP